jgi:hypothetical protein
MPTEALQAICDAAVSDDGLPGIVLGIDATALLRALLFKVAPLVDFPLHPAGPASDLLLLST